MALFTVVLMNPLSPLVKDDESLYQIEGGAMGRSILGTESQSTLSHLMKISVSSLLISAVYFMFLIGGLIRIFVYGEPKIGKGEPWSRYWRQRKQADRDMEAGRSGPAAERLTN